MAGERFHHTADVDWFFCNQMAKKFPFTNPHFAVDVARDIFVAARGRVRRLLEVRPCGFDLRLRWKTGRPPPRSSPSSCRQSPEGTSARKQFFSVRNNFAHSGNSEREAEFLRRVVAAPASPAARRLRQRVSGSPTLAPRPTRASQRHRPGVAIKADER